MPKVLKEQELIGNRFNRLTITGLTEKINGRVYVIAVCDCGVIKNYQLGHLTSGSTKSCGCKRIEMVLAKNEKNPANFQHGLNKHPLFSVWNNMISRCYREKSIGYKNYGGNGVTVCKEWRESCMAFYNWAVANGWKPGLQLDKDKLSPNKTGKIYSPKYCCFLTRKENMQYRKNAILISYKGQKNNTSKWAEILNIDVNVIRDRYKQGWNVKDIFEKPIRTKNIIKQKAS